MLRLSLLFCFVYQRLESERGQFGLRQLYGCERRRCELRQTDIVEPDDRQIAWYLDLTIVCFAKDSNRSHVIRAQKGPWSLVRGGHQVSQPAHATFQRVIPFHNQVGR